jgi:hypothetical protein
MGRSMTFEKGILIVIIFFALGLFVIPQTVSLFEGEHFWYSIEGGYGSKCLKCHADIYEELNQSAYHDTIDGVSGFSGNECYSCHRANLTITYANGSLDQPGREAHAASSISCTYCHFNASNPFNAPVAGGFGMTGLANDTGTEAAHRGFVLSSANGSISGSSLLLNASEACIACHTPVEITINFSVPTQFDITVRNSVSGSNSQWNVESIVATNLTVFLEEKK